MVVARLPSRRFYLFNGWFELLSCWLVEDNSSSKNQCGLIALTCLRWMALIKSTSRGHESTIPVHYKVVPLSNSLHLQSAIEFFMIRVGCYRLCCCPWGEGAIIDTNTHIHVLNCLNNLSSIQLLLWWWRLRQYRPKRFKGQVIKLHPHSMKNNLILLLPLDVYYWFVILQLARLDIARVEIR